MDKYLVFKTLVTFLITGVLCVSVCSNWLDLEPAANESGIFVGARPTFERCGVEVRLGGGDCMCGVGSWCGKLETQRFRNKRRVRSLVGWNHPKNVHCFLESGRSWTKFESSVMDSFLF